MGIEVLVSIHKVLFAKRNIPRSGETTSSLASPLRHISAVSTVTLVGNNGPWQLRGMVVLEGVVIDLIESVDVAALWLVIVDSWSWSW